MNTNIHHFGDVSALMELKLRVYPLKTSKQGKTTTTNDYPYSSFMVMSSRSTDATFVVWVKT